MDNDEDLRNPMEPIAANTNILPPMEALLVDFDYAP